MDVDKFFLHFENVAVNQNWPKGKWAVLLQSVLRGKAQQAYLALSMDKSKDYGELKRAVLRSYELVPEAYRQKFRNLRKPWNHTYLEFAREMQMYCERWCASKGVIGDYDKLLQLILMEQFKGCIPESMKTYLDEKETVTLSATARLADEYALTHKTKFSLNKSYQKGSRDARESPLAKAENKPGASGKGKEEENQAGRKVPNFTCYNCGKAGHIASKCFVPKKETGKGKTAVPTGCIESVNRSMGKAKLDRAQEGREKFISERTVSVKEGETPVPVRIWRDTGADQSLILRKMLDFGPEIETGEVVLRGIGNGTEAVPLHRMFLKYDLVSGPVEIGVRSKLPMDGVDVLLGKDLAGGDVYSAVELTSKPVSAEDPPIDSKIYPTCAITRSMSRKAAEKGDSLNESRVDLVETFLPTLYEKELPEEKEKDSGVKESKGEEVDLPLARRDFIKEQSRDEELVALNESALSELEIDKEPGGYYLKGGVLMRKWRPTTVPVNEDWAVVVVLKVYRDEILNLAHKGPLGGHLGVRKTVDRVMKDFYWPNMRKDIVDYCKRCHTCQVLGKPNQVIPKAPLRPIPTFGEPFFRIIVDFVGPLLRTASGRQYIMTMMCAATRFPEAVPLGNIRTPAVVKALNKFFTTVGLPREIQSDQGSTFTSRAFQQILTQMGVKQILASACHPESQGFHATLKTMIKTYCQENTHDWDDAIPLLLFAVRDTVQESLGFSPFELVFGHRPREPLTVLKEKWSSPNVQVNVIDYVLRFRERLHKFCEFAKQNLKDSRTKMKQWYDK
ncbi:uncharacterized protein LOC132406577 [Hypanus sabinus]|uniref:uncharacterized protein LOC132406577 n=1 Tax=Hypanus sabinus TaxID=79690 RepID=UPI0028C4532C|nr:uncharacterized protein LOC132406577 [Hypanus sabinus]